MKFATDSASPHNTSQSGLRLIRVDANSGTRVEADFGYHPKPTRLELEGAC